MERKNRMTYATCAVCGKRSRQPGLTAEQSYGWEPWFVDGMPKYSEIRKVYISEVCPYCGYTNRSIEEGGIANLLDFKSEEYRNPLQLDEDSERKYGGLWLTASVKACMRTGYLLKSSDVACYGIALEEYLTAIWLLDGYLVDHQQNDPIDGGNQTCSCHFESVGNGTVPEYETEFQRICHRIRNICLEKAIYCCGMVRKRDKRNEDTLLLVDLYRRRGLVELAIIYAEEMLEHEMWDSIDEKLMIRQQIELCKRKDMKPAELYPNLSE